MDPLPPSPSAPPSPPAPTCPRCLRPTARAFDASGLCVRCVGAQIFSLTIADKPGSAPPIPLGEAALGPHRIGPYSIISELGRGGMGTVYLAQHTQLGRIVALKVIPAGGSATSDLEMRFLREARTIARLTHPHIVAVHDAGRDRAHAYFSMDYFEEGDLARRLRAQPFTPREAATLLHAVAGAIAFSHAAGVLHRDLKPSNILLAGGAPHVADFGLAAELDNSGGLTARTAVLGTPHYLAPEALNRGSAAQGVPSDIYALGVILHEMLAGRTPFAGASPAELPGLLARGDAPNLLLLAPQVPRDLATICAKCLEFDPARRYPTAAALADRKKFIQEVAASSPTSRVISPVWFEPIVVPALARPAATATTGRHVINPPGIAPLVPAYSVAIRDGDQVFVSGMTGIKPGTQDIIEGGVGAQTRQTMENIRTSLQAAGATMADVSECTVFLMDMADYAAMNSVYVEFFTVNPPARAAMAVTALPRPAARVEIKCSAKIHLR